MIAALNLGLIILITGLITISAFKLAWQFRHQTVRAAGLLVLATVAGLLCSGASITALGLVDYLPLGPQLTAAADISMLQTSQYRFRIHLLRAGKPGWQHDFRGHRLCLVVHELHWHPPAPLLGFPPMYRLASLSSHGEIKVHTPSRARLSLWHLSRQHPWLFWIKASPPLDQCLPLVTGARYRLIIGSGFLRVQPLNAEAGNALKSPQTPARRNGTNHDI